MSDGNYQANQEFIAAMKERKKAIDEQKKINEEDIPIDIELSEIAHDLWPTCKAIRRRGNSFEWAIDSTRGWYWFPISRLPEFVERELTKVSSVIMQSYRQRKE